MEILLDKRESDRKCLNHARVHASAQSFDRCEVPHFGITRERVGKGPARELEKVLGRGCPSQLFSKWWTSRKIPQL